MIGKIIGWLFLAIVAMALFLIWPPIFLVYLGIGGLVLVAAFS